MIQRLSRARRRGPESGFTLIELLVVIIILGVLSSVVVFAVRGAGDKGRSNAIATDARTIKTAQESFCAQKGRYGTADELVAERLLSEKPTLNRIVLDTSMGPCGNTRYVVGVPPPAPPPLPAGGYLGDTQSSFASGGWASAPPLTGGGDQNFNTLANQQRVVGGNDLIQNSALVQLVDGKILALKVGKAFCSGSPPGCPSVKYASGAQVFDPANGPMGTWSPVATSVATCTSACVPTAVPSSNIGGHVAGPSTVLRGPASWCGENCGKVLVRLGSTEHYVQLYTPPTSATDGGSWESLAAGAPTASTPQAPFPARRPHADAIQLLRTPCGSNCGKVLIVGEGQTKAATSCFSLCAPVGPELFNPIDKSFQRLGLVPGYPEYCEDGATCSENSIRLRPLLAPLKDGRVLMLVGLKASIFDPVAATFTPVTGPPIPPTISPLTAKNDYLEPLDDGRVLVILNQSSAASALMYDPTTDTWTPASHCGNTGTPSRPFCGIIAKLPDGKLLGGARRQSTITAHAGGEAASTKVFDPTANAGAGAWTTITAGAPLAPTSLTDPLKTNMSATSHFRDAIGMGILIREVKPGSCGNLCNRVITLGVKFYSGAATVAGTAVAGDNLDNLPASANIFTP